MKYIITTYFEIKFTIKINREQILKPFTILLLFYNIIYLVNKVYFLPLEHLEISLKTL